MKTTSKFIYRPKFDMSFAYDLNADPQEDNNIVSKFTTTQLEVKKQALLQWYKFQTRYIDQHYPNK